MKKQIFIITMLCLLGAALPAAAQFTVSGVFHEPFVTQDSPVEKYRLIKGDLEGPPARIDIFRIGDNAFEKVDTISTAKTAFQVAGLAEGDYLMQVIVPGFLIEKRRFFLSSDLGFELKLRRPIDFGNGPVSLESKYAGARHAFGCNSVSLIFVQWSGGSSWTNTLRGNALDAARSGMDDFENQAPPGAKFRSHVENLGTYTVSSPVGNTCGQAEAWIDEVLDDMGRTSGSVSSRLDTLARDRAEVLCGSVPYCQSCGLESSGFLFFIARNSSNPGGVGGWNCGGGRFQISYFGRSDDPEVYTHEIGHAFGTTDEYCVQLSNFGWYCCGWTHLDWGCDNTGGCLNVANDNCDPACGQDCFPGTPGVQDCRDGCPLANCTTHTPCTMDGSATTTFCEVSRRQMGWQDSDGDGYPDCLETDCGTNPNSYSSRPNCIQPYDVYVDGDWSGAELGTIANPYNTVREGHDGCHEGDTLNIKNGPFNETLTMDKEIKVEKWGAGADVVIGSP